MAFISQSASNVPRASVLGRARLRFWKQFVRMDRSPLQPSQLGCRTAERGSWLMKSIMPCENQQLLPSRAARKAAAPRLHPWEEQIINLYHEIEIHAGANVSAQCRAIAKLVRR